MVAATSRKPGSGLVDAQPASNGAAKRRSHTEFFMDFLFARWATWNFVPTVPAFASRGDALGLQAGAVTPPSMRSPSGLEGPLDWRSASSRAIGMCRVRMDEKREETKASDVPPDPMAPAQAAAKVEYVCPMHPQIVRAGPGSCPICGMA